MAGITYLLNDLLSPTIKLCSSINFYPAIDFTQKNASKC